MKWWINEEIPIQPSTRFFVNREQLEGKSRHDPLESRYQVIAANFCKAEIISHQPLQILPEAHLQANALRYRLLLKLHAYPVMTA